MKEMIKLLSDNLEKKYIPDDLLYEFSQDVIQFIRNSDTEQIPDAFWDFQYKVELYWRGQRFCDEMNSEFCFQMGQILSYVNMIKMVFESVEKEISIEEYAESLKEKYLFFQYIHNEKGITHKLLAEKLKMSPSALSQFTTKIHDVGFFMARVMGREKHYYLTERGEKLYELMSEKYYHSLSDVIFHEQISRLISEQMQYYKLYHYNSIIDTSSYVGLGKTILKNNFFTINSNNYIFDNRNYIENNEEENIKWEKNMTVVRQYKNPKLEAIS